MPLAEDLQEREREAGNAPDSFDPAQQYYDEQFNQIAQNTENESFDDIINREFGEDSRDTETDEHSGQAWNYNQDEPNTQRDAIDSKEKNSDVPKNSDSLYTGDNKSTGGGRFDRIKGAIGNLRGNKGPMGATIAILTVFGGGTAMLSPYSLLTNLTSILNNHSSLSSHIMSKTSKSYIASFLSGGNRDCATSKIKCKFKTISEKQLKDWESRGIKVTADEAKVPGITGGKQYKVRGLEFADGTKINSKSAYANLRWTSPANNSLLKRFPIRASYLNAKSSLNRSLTKFGTSLAKSMFKSSEEKDKDKRAKANSEAMNKQTGATVDKNGVTTPESAKSAVEEKKPGSKVLEKMKGFSKGVAAGSNLALPVIAACEGYNLVRAAQAAVMLAWATKLIDFVTPFLIAGSQAKEGGVNGGFSWQTAEYFGNRLTKPVTKQDVKNNPDLYTADMIGKTAMDSAGMSAVLSGSKQVNQKYSGWAPINDVKGSKVMQDIENAVGGKENIHTTCMAANKGALLGLATCFEGLPAVLRCLTQTAVTQLAIQVFGDDIAKLVTGWVTEPAIKAIAAANLSDSLVGPALGDGLVSATQFLGSYNDLGSGVTLAGNASQAFTAYNDTMNDTELQQDQIADAKDSAAQNQFDPSNKYSFAGRLTSTIASVPYDGTLTSVFANIAHVFGATSPLATASAMQQGVEQPISFYQSQATFNDALASCQNPALNEMKMPCLGAGGQPIPVLLQPVKDCLDQEDKKMSSDTADLSSTSGDGDTTCVDKAIDYLSKTATYDDDGTKKHYVDEQTGEPTDMPSDLSSSKDSKNPFVQWIQNCTVNRPYPVGYSDEPADDDNYAWYDGTNCAAGNGNVSDDDLAWMSFYYNQCVGYYSSESDTNYCWEDAPTQSLAATTGGSAATGECSALAKQLLDSPNVQFQQPEERGYMEQTAKDCTQPACGNATMSTKLLGLLVTASQKYKITIGAQKAGHDCDGGLHPQGQAVDITGVRHLDQPQQTIIQKSDSPPYPAADIPIIKEFDEFVDQTAANSGFALQIGQQQCFNGNPPVVRAGTMVNDACHHIHLGVKTH